MARIPAWLPSVAVGALLLGAGVAAAAATDGSSGIETAQESSTTVPTELSTTTTVVGLPDETVPDADDVDGDGTSRYWGAECGENPTNHGGYVRRAERNGASRSEAAHSPCGKPLSSVKVTSTTAAGPPPDVESESAPSGGEPGSTPGGGNGGGKGNGGGRGKGRGHNK